MKVWRHPLMINNRALLEAHKGLEAQIPTVQKAPMPEAQKRQQRQVKKNGQRKIFRDVERIEQMKLFNFLMDILFWEFDNHHLIWIMRPWHWCRG